jgi:tRNA A-37 threonylcarbamoyl transferase component Bud32
VFKRNKVPLGFTPIKSWAGRYNAYIGVELLGISRDLNVFVKSPHAEQDGVCPIKQEDDRAVFHVEPFNTLVKFNRLKRWRFRYAKGLSFRTEKNCLIDEFVNLCRLSKSSLAPKVYGYAYKRSLGALTEECIFIEFLDGASALEVQLQNGSWPPEKALEAVIGLFVSMVDEGFCHLDPHPENIMVMPSGELKFIDFEGCAFGVEGYFSLAFCLGRFYRFWFKRYMTEQEYDDVVSRFSRAHGLNSKFHVLYHRFKHEKVSRRLVNRCFSDDAARYSFIRETAAAA